MFIAGAAPESHDPARTETDFGWREVPIRRRDGTTERATRQPILKPAGLLHSAGFKTFAFVSAGAGKPSRFLLIDGLAFFLVGKPVANLFAVYYVFASMDKAQPEARETGNER